MENWVTDRVRLSGPGDTAETGAGADGHNDAGPVGQLPYQVFLGLAVNPESTPTNELFQRVDNYYVYLKPDNVDDATIAKDVRFPGPPPLWIWMPPH